MAKPTDAKNVLNASKAFKLASWLVANAVRVRNLKHDDIAGIAQAELGFTVTRPNIVAYASAAGVDLGRANRVRSGKPATDRVRYVAKQVVLLMEQLGQPVDQGLRDVANGHQPK